MRPVNKGNSPYTRIGDYGEAQPYLENRIGGYCSFCEFPISHVPEVEHIAAKTKEGDLTAWDNLLLGCKYCNTRKGIKVTTENVEKFLWPDRYNTALAYTYDYGVPKVHETLLETVDPSGDVLNKAQNLFELVKLDNQPKLGEKDRRARQRNKVFTQARDSLADYLESKNEAMLRQIAKELDEGIITVEEAMRRTKINSRSTFYRKLRKLKDPLL